MPRPLLIFCAVLLVGIASCTASAQSDPSMAEFDRLMEGLLEKYEIPGGSLAISRDGKLVYAKGFGFADVESKKRVDQDSLFRIASLSKPFTAVATLRLAQRNKLRLNDKVYKILDDFPVPVGRVKNPEIFDITISDLLRHNSGQAVYNASGIISSPMQPPVSREISQLFGTPHPPAFKYIAGYMQTQPLLNPPGENHKYSNYGYALLGEVIQKITDTPYEHHVREKILQPIGITKMELGKTLKSQRRPGEVTYYDLEEAALRRSVFDGEPPGPFPYAARHHEGWGASGAWIASPTDIVKFVNHVDGRRKPAILAPRVIQKMVEDPKLPDGRPGFWYGMGWRIQKKKGGHHWYHDGSSSVGAATLMVRTKDGIVWAASFNRRLPRGRAMYKEFNREMWKLTGARKKWPRHDLF